MSDICRQNTCPSVTSTSDCVTWPFSKWRMDVIGPITPKASNEHRFTFVVINYFIKQVEAMSYTNVMKAVVSRFIKKEIICGCGPQKGLYQILSSNLNTDMIKKAYTQFKIKHHNSAQHRPKMNGGSSGSQQECKKDYCENDRCFQKLA